MTISNLILAQQLTMAARHLLASETVEARKRPPRAHDPLVTELGEILGAKLAQTVSSLLDKNFPGVELGNLRQSIRADTVSAFRKSLARNYNSQFDAKIAPSLQEEVKEYEAAQDAKIKQGGGSEEESEPKSEPVVEAPPEEPKAEPKPPKEVPV